MILKCCHYLFFQIRIQLCGSFYLRQCTQRHPERHISFLNQILHIDRHIIIHTRHVNDPHQPSVYDSVDSILISLQNLLIQLPHFCFVCLSASSDFIQIHPIVNGIRQFFHIFCLWHIIFFVFCGMVSTDLNVFGRICRGIYFHGLYILSVFGNFFFLCHRCLFCFRWKIQILIYHFFLLRGKLHSFEIFMNFLRFDFFSGSSCDLSNFM